MEERGVGERGRRSMRRRGEWEREGGNSRGRSGGEEWGVGERKRKRWEKSYGGGRGKEEKERGGVGRRKTVEADERGRGEEREERRRMRGDGNVAMVKKLRSIYYEYISLPFTFMTVAIAVVAASAT